MVKDQRSISPHAAPVTEAKANAQSKAPAVPRAAPQPHGEMGEPPAQAEQQPAASATPVPGDRPRPLQGAQGPQPVAAAPAPMPVDMLETTRRLAEQTEALVARATSTE